MKIGGDSRTPAINELKDLIVSTRKLSKEEIESQSGGGSGNSTSIDDDADTDVEGPGNDSDGPRDDP